MKQYMTLAEVDLLEAWLQTRPWARQVTVHERTCCVILYYDGARETMLDDLRAFDWQQAEHAITLPEHSSRAMNREFTEKLVGKVVWKTACTLFLPPPLCIARIVRHMIPFLRRGWHCLLRRRIQVELLDALSMLMVGDGINDSLSEADAGIAISDGAVLAREIADITIAADTLWELVELRRIAVALMQRIDSNYRFVIGFNGSLIVLGVAGVLSPAASATLHNLSTLGVSLRSMRALPPTAQRPTQ